MTRVLFISALDTASEVENRYRPLWPAYLAAFTERAMGPDAAEFRYMTGNLDRELDEYKPDIVAIGSVSQNYQLAREYARLCKARGATVMMGGPHISALPQCITGDVDVACIGEGEESFVDLLRLYKQEDSLPLEGLKTIEGIAYRGDTGIVQTALRPLMASLDDIPHPKRSLVGYQRHDYMFTSRGCPYRCAFCASSRFWNKVRLASAEYVVEEIEELVHHGSRVISFYDDLFVIDKKRVKRIADLLSERGLLGKVKFTCSCRANTISEDLVESLKRLHVVSVGMGLESGCDRTLQYLKGQISVATNRKAVNLLKDAGIQVNASFVIGAPEETEQEVMETYNFIQESRLDFVDTYVLMPLPGTPVWDFALEQGLVSDDMDWSRLNVNFEYNADHAVLVSQALGRDDIKRLYRMFRRQRMFRILRALPGSPWLRDLPRAAWRTLREKGLRLLRRRADGHLEGS